MLNIVVQAINQFYRERDYNTFKTYCAQSLPFFKGLKRYLNEHNLALIEEEDKTYPSRTWTIHFDDYKKKEFELSLNTELKISKVAPIFYIQHNFLVVNKDKDGLEPTLDGWNGEGYTIAQFNLHEKITTFLNKKGYHELFYVDMIEPVQGFKMPDGIVEFGNNVTTNLLLFKDLMGILTNN